jgi:VWFA-related protein
MNISRRDWIAALTLLPATRLLAGQQTQGTAPASPAPTEGAASTAPAAATDATQPKFSSDVNVVNLFVTVRNKQGNIVKDLTKDDFLLDEEGKPQTIKYFSQENNLPLYLGLLVDTSGSQRTVLNDERTASFKFFDQILREDRDLAFVLHFDFEVELLQDFTSSRQNLEKALDQLQISPRLQQRQGQGGQGGGYPSGGGYPGGGYPGGGYPGGGYPSGGSRPRGGTDLYDAILLASDDLMSKQKGRKALVLLTDGVDTGSKSTLFQAIESAQRADTLVYSVLFAGNEGYSQPMRMGGPGMGRRGGMGRMPPPGGGYDTGNGKKVLEQIARETGGRFFQVSHSRPLDKIYADIQEELRSLYNVAYTPDPPAPSGVYRHIHLLPNTKVKKDKDLVVVTREGYWAK